MKRVLGIDPGLRKTGWAMLDIKHANDMVDLRSTTIERTGLIKVPTSEVLTLRLQALYREVAQVISACDPGLIVLEEGYCGIDGLSALKLGMVRGAIVAACNDRAVEMYSPAYIKKRTVGRGNASKHEVLSWVNTWFPDSKICTQDIADAIAIGLSCA
jgi:crossover junction endodeoxyribonuclease RuvC